MWRQRCVSSFIYRYQILVQLLIPWTISGVLVAMHISPIPADYDAWLLASSTLPHPTRPVVLPTSTSGSGSLLVLKWYHALKLDDKALLNVTGAGDSLVGSLLASVVHQSDSPFHNPARLDEAIGRAQRAAVMSLQSSFAVAPELSA